MAEAILLFGVQKLWDLLSQEYERFQGVGDQVNELKQDLNMLSSFVKDAYAKKNTSAVVRNCVEEIKEIICDAEDIIENFLLKDEHGETSGFVKRVRRFGFTILNRMELASGIGGISKRISKVIGDMQSFGVQGVIADGRYSQPLHDKQSEMRQTFSKEYERNLVGLETNIEKLVGLMVEEENVQVVSITGMGGLGKTTLARQVSNHKMIKNRFDGHAWVCVSQDFTRKSVWQAILRSLSPNEEENKILEMTEAKLQGELFRLLETSKPLIILDDVWKEEDWDLIKPVLPPQKGWKVLLTSRNQRVAGRGDTTYINFKLECLTTEDSWTLFQSVAFPKKDAPEFKVDEKMEEIGKQMIEHCGRLPLAIKVLGGLLAEKYTPHDWKRVFEDIGSHIVGETNSNGNNSSVYHVLSLSFEELPSYLKQCFLYLAHFPEDHIIPVKKLSYYWAAEGISKPTSYNGDTIRDVGDSYIEELVRRNMVISERDSRTLRFESCHLHDMMREVCLFKAKEENFLQTAGTSSLPVARPCKSRRIAFHCPTTLNVDRDINNPKLRSLLIVTGYMGRSWTLSDFNFTKLELLRVLDLTRAKLEGGKLPSRIGRLIHLRYFSLNGAQVSHLPFSLRNLKLLIYLNINVIGGSIYVPNILMEMHELRYLALPSNMQKNTKLNLGNLVNLETMVNFSTTNGTLEDLYGMVRLRTLTIALTEGNSIKSLSASIDKLKHLENLYIQDSGCNRMVEEGFVFECLHLNRLVLDIYMPRLPDDKHFPSRLTCLDLSGCRLEEDPMHVLGKLLQLKDVCLRSRSFCGRRMVCYAGGFPQLEKLMLYRLEEWEEWIIEEGSMPLLKILDISYCEKLKELPDGLQFATSLENMNMGREWEERLSIGGEDYYKVQHIPSLTYERSNY